MPRKEFAVNGLRGENERLDIFLVQKLKGASRAQIQFWIAEGKVLVDGDVKKPGYRLRECEIVCVTYDHPEPERMRPQDIPLRILHCDDQVIVLDKPSGMVVHPGAGQRRGTLVHGLIFHFPDLAAVGPPEKPGIVHRLDKETSGVILAARTPAAYKELQRQFKARQVDKGYLGLVRGKISRSSGKITWAIGRHIKNRRRMSIKSRKPRTAETHYRVKGTFKDATLLEIRPITGRTHQIRVHFSASGHPLVGDPKYGSGKRAPKSPRLFLHAHSLSFIHPASGTRVCFTSPLPEELRRFLDELERG